MLENHLRVLCVICIAVIKLCPLLTSHESLGICISSIRSRPSLVMSKPLTADHCCGMVWLEIPVTG